MSGIMDAFSTTMDNYGDFPQIPNVATQNQLNNSQKNQDQYDVTNQSYNQSSSSVPKTAQPTIASSPIVEAPPTNTVGGKLLSSGSSAAKTAGTVGSAAIPLITGIASALADADLKEPEGDAHWTLREQDNFILAKNQRTGELHKLQTVPLTAKEKKEAEAPHGAGSLDADDPKRKHSNMNDGDLKPEDFRAGPMPSYADADLKHSNKNHIQNLSRQLHEQDMNIIGMKIVSALDKKFKTGKK